MFICYYSSFYLLSFNQAANCHPEPCSSLSCWSFIEAFLSNHFSHTKTTLSHTHTHTPFVTNHPFYEESLLMTACDCTYWHDQLLGSSVKPHKHKHTQSSLPLSCRLSPGSRSTLRSPIWAWVLLPRKKLHPSNGTVTQQFTVAAGIWGPRPKPFIWGFGKSTGLVSSNTLGDNGLETHREGKRQSQRLRAGAAAGNTLWGRFQGFRSCCCLI